VNLPDVTAESEDGFVDFDLRLIRSETAEDGALHVEGWGQHEGTPLGFLVVLQPDWDPQPIEGSSGHWYWGSVLLRSVGTPSDAFVRALDALYGTALGVQTMEPEIRLTAVGIADDPRTATREPVHMKLFFEHPDETRYAEVYLNVDVSEKRVEFHEKDPDYRRPLVLALGRGAAGQGGKADEP
jgi:hypothetical protein